MKKTWIWILVCALLVAVLPLSAGAQAPAGKPVASAEELAAMESNGTYYLSDDVTITGEWQYAEFKGTLDGNGHTVYLDGATLSGGLFTVLNGATVKNLSVQALSEATFILPSNVDSYGVIAARAIGNNTVENVVAQVNILQMETTVKDVGGLVGNLRAGSLTLRNCVYAGVIGSGRSGYGNYVGGILGSTWNGAVNLSITNCVTYGAYSGQNHCGGVIGGIQQGEDKGVTNLTLQYNVNYANVVNTGGAENAGGIIGYRCAPDGGSTRILNNINYGYVANSASNGKVGGIGGNFKQCGTPADNEISGNINYGGMKSVQVSPIYNNFYYDGTWAKDPRPAAVNNYTEEMTDSGENPVPPTTDVLNDGTLAALNEAYPGTYAMLDGERITLKWALEAGYTTVLPAEQEPAYLGYQLSAPTEDGKRGIRFVASLNDLDCADAVGIQIRAITATGQSRLWLQDTDVVYTSVLADGARVTPADFDSEDQYLYTAMLGNIPVSEGSITFEIRTFVVKDGATAYSPATTVTVDVSAAAK